MANYDDRLKDYVDVKTRIAEFYSKHPDGRLVTADVLGSNEPDGVPRIMVKAYAYRSPDDTLPGVGHSWLVLPGTTPYTRGSEVENAETSAWGRAIAALGIGIDKSIASANEVANKAETPAEVNAREREQLAQAHADPAIDGLIGTAITQGTQDGELRQTPEGWTMPFRVKNGAKSFIVLAEDKMAQALHMIWPTVVDQRVTVWGHWTDETIPAKGTKPQINYRILHLERIATPDVILPPAEDTGPGAGGRPMLEEDTEAPSIPLFDEAEDALIEAALP